MHLHSQVNKHASTCQLALYFLSPCVGRSSCVICFTPFITICLVQWIYLSAGFPCMNPKCLSFSSFSTDDCTFSCLNIMLPRAGKEFLVRIRFSWRPFFQGRYLLVTNIMSGGVMLSLGDILQQTREKHRDPGKIRDWSRTGDTEFYAFNVIHHFLILADMQESSRSVQFLK